MTSTFRRLNIGKDFSRYPAGRYLADGPATGERFRNEILVPVMVNGETIVIEMDDALGYGSSFLEEAFGGLVRSGYSASSILDHIKFESFDDSLIDEIISYINDAKP